MTLEPMLYHVVPAGVTAPPAEGDALTNSMYCGVYCSVMVSFDPMVNCVFDVVYWVPLTVRLSKMFLAYEGLSGISAGVVKLNQCDDPGAKLREELLSCWHVYGFPFMYDMAEVDDEQRLKFLMENVT